jgi:uncharacterized protein (TIGR02996 family)
VAIRRELVALLDACKDAHDDDAPRLVLADWLEEHGGADDRARAEFVRSQVARERLDHEQPEWGRCLRRERELLRAHAAVWLGPITRVGTVDWDSLATYSRGLVHLPAGVAGLAAAQEREGLAASEEWAWVDGLALSPSGGDGDGGPELLCGSPLFDGLTELYFRDWNWRADAAGGLAALLASRPWTRLRALSFRHDRLPGVAGLVAAAGPMPSLARLDLAANPALDGPDAEQLCQALRPSAGLRELVLAVCDLGPEAAAVLGAAPVMGRLEALDLSGNGRPDGAAVAALSATRAPRPWRRRRTCAGWSRSTCGATPSAPPAAPRWPARPSWRTSPSWT